MKQCPCSRQYTYVVVAISPLMGRRWWSWQASMKGAARTRIGGDWVWNGAGGHKNEEMQAVDAPRVVQPPCVPELNPAECFFRELRRIIEVQVYPTLQARQEALEPVLNAWQAGLEWVPRLCS